MGNCRYYCLHHRFATYFLYALAQLNLLFNYLRARKKVDDCPKFDFSNRAEIPYVTIQLPVFNEMYVMERLLTNIAKIDYPKNKLKYKFWTTPPTNPLKLRPSKLKNYKPPD